MLMLMLMPSTTGRPNVTTRRPNRAATLTVTRSKSHSQRPSHRHEGAQHHPAHNGLPRVFEHRDLHPLLAPPRKPVTKNQPTQPPTVTSLANKRSVSHGNAAKHLTALALQGPKTTKPAAQARTRQRSPPIRCVLPQATHRVRCGETASSLVVPNALRHFSPKNKRREAGGRPHRSTPQQASERARERESGEVSEP
jgi:hypothetical protein